MSARRVAGRMFPARLGLIGLLALGAGCGSGTDSGDDDAGPGLADASDGDAAAGVDGGIGDAAPPADGDYHPATLPMCVWNQAYQENYAADTVTEILNGAEGCYVLVDPFESTQARSAIAEMKASDNIVGCYISSGTCEDWRDDFDDIKPYCVSQQWDEWGGEYFVDETTPELIALMEARIDKMAAWGCDMVEFDNMDWVFDDAYRTEYDITATPEDGIAYNQALCAYTHGKGMGCMAKNTRQGAQSFDGGTFESYSDDLNWWETSHLQGFLGQDQLGIIVHYDETDCDQVYADYQDTYGAELSFICEDRGTQKYRHYN